MKKMRVLAMAFAVGLFTISCSSDDNNGPVVTPDYDVIVGKWNSPEPAAIFGGLIESIDVEFRNNQTYTVISHNDDGSTTTLEGTYVTSDGANGIRKIYLEQSSPTSLISEGIYQVSANNTSMKYEVLQTEPDLGLSVPTPEAGFGSTADGAFGDMNIQHYNRVD